MEARNYRAVNWYDQVSAESVFEHYLGEPIVFGKMYKSPLREDAHPTCSF